jgi:hypothetical protein
MSPTSQAAPPPEVEEAERIEAALAAEAEERRRAEAAAAIATAAAAAAAKARASIAGGKRKRGTTIASQRGGCNSLSQGPEDEADELAELKPRTQDRRDRRSIEEIQREIDERRRVELEAQEQAQATPAEREHAAPPPL